jgi:uncharacterized Ntn-hydrolase superfamily protein
MRTTVTLASSALVLLTSAELDRPPMGRPAHTYSIVARDSKTGDLGVAVQSHYFSVGPVVPWAEPGVGAVATQSLVEISYGPKGLELMRQGMAAPDALGELLKKDDQREVRQVAMVDARGRVAAWTGPRCIEAAGQETGEGFSVQANLMANETVWPAMAKAFREGTGDLADRMLASLEAAQAAGGDIRGQQSAAILIVKGTASGQPWKDRIFDLRVEDHPRPLDELKRLLRLQRAYRLEDAGDEAAARGLTEEAKKAYSAAAALAGEVPELIFWQAVSLFSAGQEAEALPLFKQVFKADRNWAVLVPRLVKPGFLKADEAALGRILALAPPAPASSPSKPAPPMPGKPHP